MSNKISLKDKIKKPNATQTFFNSYETDAVEEKTESKVDIKKEINNNIINDNNTENVDVINKNNDIENETYVINDNDVIVNDKSENEDDDYLRNLASGKKTLKKKEKKVFTSFYMDPDLATEVDKIAARGQKGDKSKLINQALRKLLEDYGVL
ncbi:ribbon-helix-helix domain-containing protein [Gottfriedia acidiceleris]|uniref:ribbon-helix-helix domain-containing protein n=1 Tax=Gottfriedia acidiceleris TaxID=371036 RepID=UPI002FFDBA6C